jgi:hypothetical protein
LQTAVGIVFLEKDSMLPYLAYGVVTIYKYEHFSLAVSVELDAHI